MNTRPLAFVQALRGIAALLVVLWHASRYLGPYGTGIGAALFGSGGSMGVDLFFLISGFIMVHTTRRSDGSWRDAGIFAIKRVSRIWPVWIIALTIYLLVRVGVDGFLVDPDKRSWLLHSLLFVPMPGGKTDAAPIYGFPILGVGWTLNYEMYFYAIFAASMLFARWRWPAFFAWIVATLLLLPYCAGHLLTPADWAGLLRSGNTSAHRFGLHYLDLMTNPLILMFVAGVAIGLVYHSRLALENVRALALLCVVATACVVLQYATRWRVGHGIGQWGISLIPLMLVYCIASKRITLAVPHGLVRLGDISFSLYLFHPVVQETFDRVAGRFGYLPHGYLAVAVTTALAIAVAALSYVLVERGLCERLKDYLLRTLFPQRVAGYVEV